MSEIPDPAGRGAGRGAGFGLTPFGRLVTILLVILGLAATGLTVGHRVSGPRVAADAQRGPDSAASAARLLRAGAGSGGSAQIVEVDLTTGTERTLYSGGGIDQFAVAGDQLAVVSRGADGLDTLAVGAMGAEPRVLVSGSVIDELHGSGSSARFGFTSVRLDLADRRGNPLYVWDPASTSTTLLAVAGAGGGSAATRRWEFVPGSIQLVVLEPNGELALADPFSAKPSRPLGRADAFWGFVPGTTRLLTSLDAQIRSTELATGASSVLAHPPLPAGLVVYDVVPRPVGAAMVVLADRPGSNPAESRLLVADGSSFKELYQPPPGRVLTSATGSPNGRYIAVTEHADIDPETAASTATPGAAGTVHLIDTTDNSVHLLDASQLEWA